MFIAEVRSVDGLGMVAGGAVEVAVARVEVAEGPVAQEGLDTVAWAPEVSASVSSADTECLTSRGCPVSMHDARAVMQRWFVRARRITSRSRVVALRATKRAERRVSSCLVEIEPDPWVMVH